MKFRLEVRVEERVIIREVEDVPESSYPSDNIGLVERFLTAEMRPTQEASDGK